MGSYYLRRSADVEPACRIAELEAFVAFIWCASLLIPSLSCWFVSFLRKVKLVEMILL